MAVEITFKLPTFDQYQRLQSNLGSVLLNAGEHLARCIRNHMRHLQAARHSPLSNGRSSNHFSPDKVLEPVVSNADVTVGVAIPGISRAYHDIDIYPKEASALAIPLHASAYGISPREINDRGTYELFRINRRGSTQKGNVLYRKDEAGGLIPMYSLVTHVHQVQDPTLMPSNEQLIAEGKKGVEEAVGAILK